MGWGVSLDFSRQSVDVPHFTADASVTDNLFVSLQVMLL